MTAPGYNLYAAGPDGLGKSTIIEGFLRQHAAQMQRPTEWAYVHNFSDPDRPLALSFRPGDARKFASAIEAAVRTAVRELRRGFESDSYARQRQELAQRMQQRGDALFNELQEQGARLGFSTQLTPQGIMTTALVDGQPISDEQFSQLPDERQAQFREAQQELDQIVREWMLRMRALERESQGLIEQLDGRVAEFVVGQHFEPVLEPWGEDDQVGAFVQAVKADLIAQQDLWRQGHESPSWGPSPAQQETAALRRYAVNVVVAAENDAGAPVLFESHPTYNNLIGRVEYVSQFGSMLTDHMLIKPGSLLLANGGYLVLRVRDLFANPSAYDGLKRALSRRAVAIQNLTELFGIMPTSGLRPEPIPLNVKVVLVGDSALYSALVRLDPDFHELFRVKADFETDFPRTDENVRGVAAVIRAHASDDQTKRITDRAIGRLIEHSSRVAEDQRRLSADMGAIVDMVRQSAYWAAEASCSEVDEEHVERALEALEYRSGLVRDRMQQMIDDGMLFIDTCGSTVGALNALSLFDVGDLVFGRPARISCVTAAGSGTIVNVERETDLSGRLHDKGFMILRGFLADRFGQHRAMAMHASLTFEQLYGEIEGDSASSTELYAVLSSLADIPLSQSIAVTGSVDQHGAIQPVGGITAKIEGFYEVCKARGLDGKQGVLIPRANVRNVVLRREVADAIEAGRFHVWAAESVEEGIEILTGVPAGTRDAEGAYPERTVFRAVEDRLEQFASAMKAGDRTVAEAPRGGTAQPAPAIPGAPPPPPPSPPIQLCP
jgi:predicted ATP-dependent protease